MRLDVPYFKQETPFTCLPACVRMVLAFLGQDFSETLLASTLQTVHGWGTLPEEAEIALGRFGYAARWFQNATLERLEQLLTNRFPVILFLQAADLPHGRSGIHAIVAVHIDEHGLTCLDPMLENDLVIDLQTFQHIWSNLDCQGMVIWR